MRSYAAERRSFFLLTPSFAGRHSRCARRRRISSAKCRSGLGQFLSRFRERVAPAVPWTPQNHLAWRLHYSNPEIGSLILDRQSAVLAQRILELLAEFRKCATETTAPAILSTQTFPRGSFPTLFLFCGHCVPRSREDYPVKFVRQTFSHPAGATGIEIGISSACRT